MTIKIINSCYFTTLNTRGGDVKLLKLVFLSLIALLILTNQSLASTEWNFSSSVEGWYSRGLAEVVYSSDGNGRLYMHTTGNDPGMVQSGLSINASENNLLHVYVWTFCSEKTMNVYFMRSGSTDDYFGGTITLSNGSAGGEYQIDLSSNSNWIGTITEIRIDPSDSCGTISDSGFIAFDYVNLEQENGSIIGGVRYGTSTPIANALVRLEQNNQIKYSDYSDFSGVYEINNVIPGAYNLVSLKAGFNNTIMPITITSNSMSQNIVMLPNVGSLTGGVRINNTTTPIYNALVRLEQNGDIKYSDYSDTNGVYEFSDISPGNYKLIALKTGYENWTSDSNGGDVTITAGYEESQNIEMDFIPETISTPGTPTGEGLPIVGTSCLYETTGATSSLGHNVEYRFVWTTSSATSWSSNKYVYKTWNAIDADKDFYVKVEARCIDHNDEIAVSNARTVRPVEANTPPTVNIVSPENGDNFINLNITISGTADDVDIADGDFVERVDVAINGGNWQLADGTTDWLLDVQLQDVENLVEVRSVDSLGVYSNVQVITITLNPSTDGVDLRFDPPNYDFGEVETNSTVEKVFTLYNDGATSSNGSFLIIGDDSDQFFVDDTTFVSARGEVQGEVIVVFKPTSSGEKEARLVARSMNSDDIEIEISGTGISPTDLEVFPIKLKMYQAQEIDINTATCESNNFDIDWSIYDSSVKNQEVNQNCWVHASLALVENFGNKKNLPVTQDLSEEVGDICFFGGNTGGYAHNALSFIQSDGISEESENINVDCNNLDDSSTFLEKISGIHRYWGTSDKIAYLKKALQFGPLVVDMNVPNDGTFVYGYMHTGGIYNSDFNDQNNITAHAILLVGYNDTDRSFKAKNSWGSNWGENRCGELTGDRGYFRISYDLVYGVVDFGGGAITINNVYLEDEGSSFKIKNTGIDNIAISSITSNQSWLSVSAVSITSILPNEEVEVLISIDNWYDLSDENNTAIVTIVSNSLDNPIINIEVEAYQNFEANNLARPVIQSITHN